MKKYIKTFAITDLFHLDFQKDMVKRLTRNLCIVVQQVLFSLLRSHVIINAEDQILLVMFFLTVAESKVKLSTHMRCQGYFLFFS